MKRLINYIKDLFGAEEKLRERCLSAANLHRAIGQPIEHTIEDAEAMFKFIKKDS